jgi:hypothetical protein
LTSSSGGTAGESLLRRVFHTATEFGIAGLKGEKKKLAGGRRKSLKGLIPPESEEIQTFSFDIFWPGLDWILLDLAEFRFGSA